MSTRIVLANNYNNQKNSNNNQEQTNGLLLSTSATKMTTSGSNKINADAFNLNELNLNTSENNEEREKKIISEFVYLLDKSKQLFNGLRELPQYGHKNSQWQAYFGRTFDIYTKLWKFQQQHRQVLDQRYSFKRWQIGEIASKIGQLYYHYYLRTSESNYLNESFSFYQAIQTRAYYSKVSKEEKPDLMVKKLRYYARFIVVCLLLKKTKQVNELIQELSRHIDDYVKIYDPEDQLEWQLVKNEINDFINADSIVNVDSANIVSLSNRLSQSQVPVFGLSNESFKSMSFAHTVTVSLQEIIIVGNCQDQIKFSELSLDMFRMLQAVEREPTPQLPETKSVNEKNLNNSLNADKSATSNLILSEVHRLKDNNNTQLIVQRENPHKYLLYKPSFSQFYTYMAAAFKDLPPHGVLMLYISADSCDSHSKNLVEKNYDFGGVRTNNKKDIQASTTHNNQNSNTNYYSSVSALSTHSSSFHTETSNSSRKSSHYKETHCIYPGDLYAYLRKPLFLIVDSSNSYVFQNFPNLFNQPFVALLSPVSYPSIFQDRQNQQGNIFTLFLTNPLFGFCYICNIKTLNGEAFTKSHAHLRLTFNEIAKIVYKSKQIDANFSYFCQDDFLRVFILRFIFCFLTFRLHRGFKASDHYPLSQPKISNDIMENRELKNLILDLALILKTREIFLDLSDD